MSRNGPVTALELFEALRAVLNAGEHNETGDFVIARADQDNPNDDYRDDETVERAWTLINRGDEFGLES